MDGQKDRQMVTQTDDLIRLNTPMLRHFDNIFLIQKQQSIENTNYLFLKYCQALNNDF